MATAEQIIELRRLTDEVGSSTYTDEVLSVRIDGATTLHLLASDIWREKAATYAGLVDIKEGSSDRKLSQLYTAALKMADALGTATDDGEPVTVRRPGRTRPIERP